MKTVGVEVRVAPVDCWSCGAETRVVSSIELSTDDGSAECSVADFTIYPHLIDEISARLSGEPNIGPLKQRFSKMLGRSYMSNGCAHCDSLFGRHYEIHTRYDERPILSFRASTTDWSEMLGQLLSSDDGSIPF